jgi:xanthine dehydrogenase YagR molybdenum-binding subunit
MEANQITGTPLNRIDGLLKVTGKAAYATDYPIKNLAFGYLFKSTVASGTITLIDDAAAKKAPGVITIITHLNAPKLNVKGGLRGGALLQGPEINFNGQHIGIVIAETFEQARYAARLIKVQYSNDAQAKTDFKKLAQQAVPAKEPEVRRGDVDATMAGAPVTVDQVYETPIEHHHPMEPHATIAMWEGDKLTLYNSSQIVNGAQTSAAKTLNIAPENVRIITPYIGGGFGSKGGQWANLALAAVATKMAGRPVHLALTRQQMFNSVGLRQHNIQHIKLAATKEGKLLALGHQTTTHTAIDDEYTEPCGDCSKVLYAVPNALINYKVVPMNIIMPTYTRGPGKSTGSFALESAMDELAFKLQMDPIAFRLNNEPAQDPTTGKPWSSRKLVECLKEGAKAFGWDKRNPQPGKNIHGDYFVGYGVACGSYPARQRDSSAIIKLSNDAGKVQAVVELAAADLGTGTYTILAQTAADGLGLPVAQLQIHIGDSDLPPAAGSVGSVGATSYANAVNDACSKITTELMMKSGKQFFVRPTAAQLMASERLSTFETRMDAKPLADADNYSAHSFNANFAEVWVNRFTGMVKVKRFLAVTAAGKILNPKTARSQIIGGNVWGIGMALTEESVIDPRWGNFITRSFADYHVPVNLDVGNLDAIFINEDDKHANKLGVKGIGEVGIVGVAGAIANAVFNATGKRVRELPITPDKLI